MSIIQVSIRRPVTVFMFTVAVLVFGFVILSKLGVDLLPSIEYPTLTIRTDYENAAPAEIENLITKPIEEAVGTVKNIREMHSVSRPGHSEIILSFHWGTDMDVAGLDVREKLDIVRLPLDVENPRLLRFNPSLEPIIKLSLFEKTSAMAASNPKTDNAQGAVNSTDRIDSLIQLRRFAEEKVKRRLESLEGIAAVKLNGGLEDEIQVLLDQSKLKQFGLTVNDISQRLKSENINLSSGRVQQDTQQFLIRTINEFDTTDEMRETIISNQDGKSIYLKDIATVRQAYKERESISRINGFEAVEIAIYKEGDANAVAVSEKLRKRIDSIKKQLPDNWDVTLTYDQAVFIENAIDEVISNAIIGGLLAMLVLYAFLNSLKSTVIISLAIPVSVIASFNLMFAADVSLNIMSLGGIALAIGLLVDNAIVVLENIARKKDLGQADKQAAEEGTREVAGAVTASTFTTLAVFLPLIFVQGIAGQLFNDQALTVTFTLLASLIVALTLIPMLAGLGDRKRSADDTVSTQGGFFFRVFTLGPAALVRGIRWVFVSLGKVLLLLLKPFLYFLRALLTTIQRTYPIVLEWALRKRGLTLLIAMGMFVSSLALVPFLGKDLIPQMNQGELVLKVEAPSGTAIDEMDSMLKEVNAALQNIPGIERTYSVAGGGQQLSASPEQQTENQGAINIVIVSSQADDVTKVQQAIRERIRKFTSLDFDLGQPQLFTFTTPLEIEIRGFDLKLLQARADALAKAMTESDRFADVTSTVEEGRPEIKIVFDHEKANHFQLSVPELARRVSRQVKGDVATRYTFRDRKIDVLVRLNDDQRDSIENVKNLIIETRDNRAIPLSSVAEVSVDIGPSEIHRVSQERVAIVSSNIAKGDLDEAVRVVNGLLEKLPTAGVDIEVAGQNEEMQNSYRSLYTALLLAVFLVYIVMASQFESLLHPFVILFSVPLALTGAIYALFLTQSTVSIIVFIGLIMLAGIVVNNAIVLVDKINQGKREGLDKLTAIEEACSSRLRPIVITTVTTVLGMLPMALGLGEGAEIRAPMAITVIGGLLLSTLLTLIVIPVMYSIFDRK